MRALLALALLAPALAGCAGPEQEPPDVLVSFYPLEFLAARIAGPDLRVATLVPGGVEPHDWEPTPRDAQQARQAKAFVYNGGGLEPWADGLAADLRAAGRTVVVATEGIALRGGEQAAGEATKDPHAWLDPVLLDRMAGNVLEGLRAADPGNATAHAGRHAALRANLAALHQRYGASLATCANRNILTTHAAFTYLAERYNVTQWSISGLNPEAEPSPAAIRDAVELARRLNITHIFFETLVSPRVAQTIAQEVGAQTLVLNPLEGLTGEERAQGLDYLDLADRNLANLRLAMRCA